MRTILLIALLPLVGCEVMHQPGIVVRDKVTVAGKYGPSQKTADVITINADAPGLAEVPTPYGPIKIAQVSGTNTRLVLDPKTGAAIGTESTTILGGLAVTEHVKARGEADKSRIKEASAGVSGAIVSGAGAALVGPGVGAIPK